MKTILILISLMIISVNIKASEVIESDTNQKFYDLKRKYDKDAEKESSTEIKKKDEDSWFFIFYSLGKSVDEVNNNKFTGTSSSFGYKRFKKSFIQGYEYHIISNKEKYKSENHKITLGYKPNTEFKYSPYLEYQFGFSNFKDLEQGKKSFGYINSLELGLFIRRLLPIHIMAGTRFSFASYDEDYVSKMKSQEIFLRIGFEF